MNPELETLKYVEQQLEGGMEFRHTHIPSLISSVETALTIIKNRKQAIEEKEFNDPNYYQKARGEYEIP